MRIKNFFRFIKENLDPEPVQDKTIKGDVRHGDVEPDYDDSEFDDWQPTGDKPRKQKPDINSESGEEDFDYKDYYPDEDDEEDDDFDFEDDLYPMSPDEEPFISDTDVEPDGSDRDDPDYLY